MHKPIHEAKRLMNDPHIQFIPDFNRQNLDGWLNLWGFFWGVQVLCVFVINILKKIIFGINSQLLLVFKMNSQASGSMEFYRTLCYFFFFYEIQNRNINNYNKINPGLERHDSPIYSSTDVNYLKSLNMSNFNKI